MPGIMKSGLIKWHLLWMLWLPLFVTGQDLSGEILSITQPGCDPPSIGAISVNGLDGLPPYSYTLDASIIQADGDFSNLVLGNHIIVINDANDAVFTINFTIEIASQLVISVFDLAHVACFGNTDGFISVLASSGCAPFQYSIDGGVNFQSDGDFNNLGSGNYQIIAVDGVGHTDTVNAEILALSEINILAINQNNIDCFGSSTGSVELLGELGTSPYSFSIDGISYQSSGLFENLAAGQYQFWLEDLNGCTDTLTLLFTEPPPFNMVDFSITDVNCFNGNGASIEFEVNGGDPPYTFQLDGSNDVNIPFFGGLEAGDYLISAIDDNNCQVDSLISVEEPDSLYFQIQNVQLPLCSGGNNGSLELIGIGGLGPYQYRKGTNPWQNTGVFIGLTSGSYVFKVKDANGCVFTMTYVLGSHNPLNISLIDKVDVYCDISSNGSIEVLASGGVGPYTYSLNGNPNQSTGLFTSLTSGTYTIDVLDANLCAGSIIVELIETNDLLIDDLIVTNAICGSASNGDITVLGSGGVAPYQYILDNGIPQLSNVFNNVSIGPHTITLLSNLGCSVISSVYIFEDSPLGASVQNIVDPICEQSMDGLIELLGNSGTGPYNYSIDYGANWEVNGLFTGLSDSTYFFLIQDQNGCLFDTTISLTQQNQLYIELVSGSTALCPGSLNGTLEIEGQNGVTPYSYSSDGNAYSSVSVFSGLTPGDHTFWIQDANACIFDSTFTIEALEAPSVNVDSLLPPTCFGDNDGAIYLSPTGDAVPYQYALGADPFQAFPFYTGLSTGSYSVTIVDTNLCETVQNVNIIGVPLFSVAIDSIQHIKCKNEESGAIYFSFSGGQSPYSYRINGGSWQVANSSISPLFDGTYNLDFIDANGCIFSEVVEIEEPNFVLNAEIMDIFNVTCNSDTNGYVSGYGSGGVGTKMYSLDNITFQSGGTFTNLGIGNYIFYVRDANGCTSSESFSITASSSISLVWATETPPSCETVNNGFLSVGVILGSFPFTFQLNSNPPQPGGSFSNLGEGFYSVLVTDANGCQATITSLLNSVQTLEIALDSVENINCVDSANGEFWLSASGGDPSYDFYVNGTFIPGGHATGLDNGVYQTWVIDDDGCSDSLEVAVLQESLLQGSIYSQQNILCNNGNLGNVTVNGTTGTSPYQYSIDGLNYSIDNTFTNLEEGSYIVNVQDATGCIADVEVEILLLTQLNLQLNGIIPPSCFGLDDAEVSFSISNGIGPYEYGLDGGGLDVSNTFSGLLSGAHYVYAEDSQGCNDSLSFMINDPAEVQILIDSIGLASCFGMSDAFIALSVENTDGIVNYTLSPGAVSNTNGLFTGLGDGIYTISIADANNCSNDTIIEINSPSSLGISINEINPINCFGEENAIVEVIVSGGIAPYYYFIDNLSNGTNQFINNLAAGMHEILVLDSNNCQAEFSFTLEEPDSIYVQNDVIVNVSCFGFNNGIAFFNANGGSGDLEYELNTSEISTSGSFNNLAPALYTLYISDTLGCSIEYEFEITEPSALLIDTIITSDPTCFGDTNGSIVIVASGGTPPFNYYLPGMGTFTDSIISNLDYFSNSISVSDQNGCNVMDFAAVTQPVLFSIDVLALVPPICFGDSSATVLVGSSGGTGAAMYGLSIDDLQTSDTFHNLLSGMTQFFGVDSLGCSDSTFVFIPTAQQMFLEPVVEDVSCFGSEDGSIELNASGGNPAYTFSMDQVTWMNSDVFGGLIAGEYTLYVKDSNGCIEDSSIVVSQPDSLISTVSSIHPVTCSDPNSGEINIEINGGSAPYLSDLNNSILSGSSVTFVGLPIGSYQIITTDTNGCIAFLDTALLQVENMSAYIDPVELNCYGDNNGIATVQFSGGSGQYLFQWDNSSGDVTASTQANLEAGITYTVMVTDSLDESCFTLAEITPTEPPQIEFELFPFSPSCDPNDLWMSVEVLSGGVEPLQFALNDEDPVSSSVFSGLNKVSSRFKIIDANGCFVSQWMVPENPNVIEAFFEVNDDVVSMAEGDVIFTDLSGNSALMEWDFGDGIVVNGLPGDQALGDFTNGQMLEPLHTYKSFGVYMAVLSVSSDFGCEDEYEKSITVLEDHRVFIPNSFSPDGDGINDVFKVEGSTIDEEGFTMRIYDRSGVLVFQSFDRSIGWDGNSKNGAAMQPIVYVYMVSYYSGGRLFEKNGTVNLLR